MSTIAAISDLITGTVLFNKMNAEIIQGSTPLTYTQFRILVYLVICRDDRRRIRDIAQELVLSTSAVSDTASLLEEQGLVEKSLLPSDLKAVALAITEEGRDVARRAGAALLNESSFYFDILGEETTEAFLANAWPLFSHDAIDEERARALHPRIAYAFYSRIHLSSYTAMFKSTFNFRLIDVRVLFLLMASREPLRISDISYALNESPSSVSSSIRSLLRVRRLIIRQQNEANRREALVSLNDDGERVAQEVADRFVAFCMRVYQSTEDEFEANVLSRVHRRATITFKDRIFGTHFNEW